MKVEIDTAALADAVAWTSRVIDARPSNPILAGVKLEAIDGTLQFSAFNYEISARHHIEAGVDEAGSVLVQGKLLADITKSLRSEKTYLVTDGSTLTITSGKSKFTLQLMPDTEYPDLPVVPAMLGQVDAPTFVQAVNQACVAVSREENRPVLTGVRMQFQGDKVVMTGGITDGTSGIQAVLLNRVDAASLPQKTELTLACMNLDWDLRSRIVKFNRESSQYRIVVKD